MASLNSPETPVRPRGAEGPVYPRITRAEGDFFETEDPYTFIESIAWPDEREPDAPEIVYVQFHTQRRWKQWGDCFHCGNADIMTREDGSYHFGDYNIVFEPGKTPGEKYSVRDLDYSTRKDIPCSPDYPRLGRMQADRMGVPYVCGFQFAELEWIY